MILIFIMELILQSCTTIGLCTIIYVIAKQPITPFVVIVWGITSMVVRLIILCFEKCVKKFKTNSKEYVQEIPKNEEKA